MFEWNRELKRIDQPVDKTEWGMTPPTINAYYNPSFNEIVFPAAILQPPFFDPNADDAVNYGGIGAVIGHEISHGFDDQGSKYDGNGVLKNWWTDDDRKNFDARTAALVKQYDAYEPLPGLHVIGKNTLGENIADLRGTRHRAQGLSHLARRQAGARDRWLHRRPALLPGLWPDLASKYRDERYPHPDLVERAQPVRRSASSAPRATWTAGTPPSTSSRATNTICRRTNAFICGRTRLKPSNRRMGWRHSLLPFALLLVAAAFVRPATAQEQTGREFTECAGCPPMVGIPAGKFVMGSPAGEAGRFDSEGPQHVVSVKAFALGKFDVTSEEFLTFLKTPAISPSPCNTLLNMRWHSPGGGSAYPPYDVGAARAGRPSASIGRTPRPISPG